MLSRLIYGARTSMALACAGVILAGGVGVLIGLVSGYWSQRLDAVIMRIADVQLSFPYLLLAIAFMALLGTSLVNLIVVLVLRSWVVYARLVRVSALSLKEREFVTAARGLGLGSWRILLRHVAPNVAAPVIVVSTLQLAELIIVEASLELPRARRAAPAAELGDDGQPGTGLSHQRLVARHLSWAEHRADRPRHEPGRGRSPGHPGSPSQAVLIPVRTIGAP